MNKKSINVKSFLLYTIPFIIEYAFLQSTDFVDTTLSAYVNESTIVSVSTMVLIIAVIRIFSKVMATTNEIIISRMYGKNNQDDKVNVISYNAFVICSIINIAICFLVYIFSKQIIYFMGFKDEQTFIIANSYLSIRLIGCLLAPAQQIIQSRLKVINKSKQVMIAKVTYTILNIFGDTISVVFGYGAIGIAVSTVICELIEVIILIIFNKGIHIRKLDLENIKEIAKIYKVNILSKLGHRLGVVIFTSLASNLEQNVYANYVLAIQIMYLGTSISEALGESTLIQIGHLIGEDNKGKIKQAKKVSIESSHIISLMQIMTFIIFSKPMLRLISNNTYNDIAVNLMGLFIVEMVFETLQYPLEGYLLAYKKVNYVTKVNLEGVLIIRIISAIILLKLGFNIYGIALALVIDYFIRYVRYNMKIKKYKHENL